ncbi:MAG: hypothetical protein ACC645_11600 [Pirellulales bacterium]
MLRMAIYWLLCCMTIATVVLIWRVVSEPPQLFRTHIQAMWAQYTPVIFALLLLLPLMLIDVISWTNRLAGPMTRLRRSMNRLADGEAVEKIAFRGNDFWHGFAADFNRLVVRVQRLEATQHQSPLEPQEQPEEPVASVSA